METRETCDIWIHLKSIQFLFIISLSNRVDFYFYFCFTLHGNRVTLDKIVLDETGDDDGGNPKAR